MYHSVSFWTASQGTDTGGRNSWASWRLMSASRPFISPPVQKTYYQDIPYVDGKLDSSDLGLTDAVFENREGTFEFIITNPNIYGWDDSRQRIDSGNAFAPTSMPRNAFYCKRCGDYLNSQTGFDIRNPIWRCKHVDSTTHLECGFNNKIVNDTVWDWDTTYSTVMDYLQGERRKIVFEDDPSFYYIGRTEVENLSSEEKFTKLNIKCDVEAYKKLRFSTAERWVWDAIDFEVNPDIIGYSNIVLNNSNSGETWWFGGSVRTLRKRINLTINVAVTSNPSSEDTSGSIVGVTITEHKSDGSTDTRGIFFKAGKNKAVQLSWDSIDFDSNQYLFRDPLEAFYFEGMTNHDFTITNLMTNGKVKITFDYRLEGF